MKNQQVDTMPTDEAEMQGSEAQVAESDPAGVNIPETIEEKLHAELAASEARVLRAYADFENYKKRFDREIARQIDNERDKFIHAILSVADNLRRALRVDNAESSPYRDGLLSVMRNIDNILRDFGAEAIPAEKGQQMDPHLHEAVTTLSIPNAEHGSIIDVAEPGYVVGERVVRPAKVVVAKSDDED